MKIFLLSIFLSVSFFSYSQDRKIVKFEELDSLIQNYDEGTLVINFWATWCKPCIQEINYIDSVGVTDADKIVLVSLDMSSMWETKVIPFTKKKELESDVWLLDEVDFNSWIPKVDPNWQGNIPATLIINNKTNKRYFHAEKIEEKEYIHAIKNTL